MAFLTDLRLAARQLRAVPGYTIAAVATLALAIGASSAIFSAVYSVLLKPMPLRQPEQLAVAWGESAALAMRVIELSYLDIRDIAEATPAVGRVAAMGSSPWNVVLDGQGEPVRLAATGVSGTFFDVVGATPQLGRLIGPDDDRPNAAPVVVLSHRTWTARFGGDPAIVGRRIQLDDQPAEVTTLATVVDKEMAPWRFSAWVFTLFAALAIGLASVGLFSLVSLDVTNRQREFAIRIAVGASQRQIVGGVFKSAGVRAAAGIAGGVAAALVRAACRAWWSVWRSPTG